VIKDIIQYPDDRLRAESAPVSTASLELAHAMDDLLDTFRVTANCIGLAAPQIGHALRIIVVDVSRSRSSRIMMLNPRIYKASDDMQLVNDGCMSVGWGLERASTRRPKRIKVRWEDWSGEGDFITKEQKFSGLMAACIDHEIDHLNGRLFVDPPKP
jgi:peptide deformylase